MKTTNKIFSRFATTLGAVFLSAAFACDEPSQSAQPTTKPAMAVTTPQPVEAPVVVAAYPIKPPSSLQLDGRDVSFPAAKLAVVSRGTGGFTLCLCSDDPPTAIDPGYVGNSYVMYMHLPIDRLSDLPAATWDFRSADSSDSASGIFLHGNRDQYRPDNVHISFQKNGDELLAFVTGTFLHNDASNPAAPSEHVEVTGSLHTNLPTD